jgi:hypothetical protein
VIALGVAPFLLVVLVATPLGAILAPVAIAGML